MGTSSYDDDHGMMMNALMFDFPREDREDDDASLPSSLSSAPSDDFDFLFLDFVRPQNHSSASPVQYLLLMFFPKVEYFCIQGQKSFERVRNEQAF